MSVCHATTITVESPREGCLRRSHFTIYSDTVHDAGVCARVLHEYIKRQVDAMPDDSYLPED
jgi:hypothetical protein